MIITTIDQNANILFPHSKFHPGIDRDSFFSISGNRVIFSSRRMRRSGSTNLKLRKEVEEFTQSSAYRLQRYLREAKAKLDFFVTLTYPASEAPTGKEAKRHLKLFFQRVKRIYSNQKRPYSACWFMEFTETRGTIHFHILQNKFIHHRMLAAIWVDIVKVSNANRFRHLKAGTNIKKFLSGRRGAARYASKYASKLLQKVKPEELGWIGRYWGKVGDVAVCAVTVEGDIFVQKYMNKRHNAENMGQKVEKWTREGSIRVIDGEIVSKGIDFQVWILDGDLAFDSIKRWLIEILEDDAVFIYHGWQK